MGGFRLDKSQRDVRSGLYESGNSGADEAGGQGERVTLYSTVSPPTT
jgi:hypothetical protein